MGKSSDIVIIGASSSGLFAAEQLARAGRQVHVYEQHETLNPARRTLIITPSLNRVLGFIPKEAVLHQTSVMALASPNAANQVVLHEPDMIVERKTFIHLLARRAQEAGARLHLGRQLQHIEPNGQGLVVHLRHVGSDRQEVVQAGALIGADGAFSQVTQIAGIPGPATVPILQAEVPLPTGWDPAVVQCWFDREDTRFFYWLIPESTQRGVLGLVADHTGEARPLLTRFLARLGLKPLAYQGAQVAMHHPRLRPWTRLGAAPVYLIGDAAGQVKVTTVGGTLTGLWGAKAAVQALIRGTQYAQELRDLKRELDLHWFVRVLLDRLDNPGYDQLLRSVTPAVQDFLGRYTRDQMAGVFWRLALRQPRLLALGVRCLLRVRKPVHRPVGVGSGALLETD
ncbi:MAG TPA: NAD(P)/FAD-dependent oxidoreductase [Anaerolineae bacterium]|nr:NAD(P)/FAD-dependent oxidoreductase [Anaerolineae bacterium]HIQ05807.1 NAD(P)/FAD-dependent oxidoreductase [Anaerolineae bacterium]